MLRNLFPFFPNTFPPCLFLFTCLFFLERERGERRGEWPESSPKEKRRSSANFYILSFFGHPTLLSSPLKVMPAPNGKYKKKSFEKANIFFRSLENEKQRLKRKIEGKTRPNGMHATIHTGTHTRIRMNKWNIVLCT